MQTEAPLNWHNTIEIDNFEAKTTINTNLPLTEEQYVERQEFKMNFFFLSNMPSNKNVTGLKPETILGLDLFQISKFNQLGFSKYQSIHPLEIQNLPFSGKSAFHLKWNKPSFPSKK